jgi:hypothetical protein
VVITGIVTARKSSGVFLQSPGHVADNQAATSEGISVHMSSTPPTPVNRVVTPSLPGTLRSPLTNLVNLLWSGERYCHGLDGTAQVLDQMLL